MTRHLFVLIAAAASLAGCSSQDIPQAHKGRLFDKTGIFALYAGGDGFKGPILGPGTKYTGLYPEVRMVDCAQRTVKEPLEALTKDGVQFNLDIYVRYSANCDEDRAVEKILSTLAPAGKTEQAAEKKDEQKENKNDVDHDPAEPFPDLTITNKQIYTTYIRPGLGEAVRESISPYIANEVNAKREEIFQKIKDRFQEYVAKGDPRLVTIYGTNLPNLDFPDQLEAANTDRATQSVLKDKAIAERERVSAEIETTKMRKQLAENEADNEVARISAIGKALRTNPEYLQYDAQQRWNDIYFHAGEHGNMVIAAPSPSMFMNVAPKK